MDRPDHRPVHASIARITLAESTGTSVTYQHVLLVDPYSTGSGCAFRPVGGAGNQCGADVLSGHVDGVTWYGNKLFVATGHQLQVYDLVHLWKMSDTSTDQVGILGNGKSLGAPPQLGTAHGQHLLHRQLG
ncbi:hypothetical protein [Streptomyces avermitilis]|uniref:hypothetical protein n=1 Tax=Streptomyces avermitilis TaxID=33903 RepID=UPI0033B605C1